MKSRFFLEIEMSKIFATCVLMFAVLAYAGIYYLIISNVPMGRLLLEVSMLPASAAILFEVSAILANWKARRRSPVFLR